MVGPVPWELVLDDGRRVPVADEVTIGRAADNALRLNDPSVSRHHARISARGRDATIEDVGSRYGTWLDGRRVDAGRMPLRDGSRLRLGDQELRVERKRSRAEPGRTIVVRSGASLALATPSDDEQVRPRLRSGYALKRLAASEGDRRWVLRDLRTGKFLRLADADAELLELFDGEHTVSELLQAADSGRLARLLAELQDRGLLAGASGQEAAVPTTRLRRLLRPRKTSWGGAAELFARLYCGGGRLLFTRPAGVALAALALVGIGVFGALIAGRYGTPFVVANKVGPGGLVFVAGRFLLVALHETAHGVALAAVGRRA